VKIYTQAQPSSRTLVVAITLYAASGIKFFDRDPLSQQVGPQGPIQLVVLAAVVLMLVVTMRRHSQRIFANLSARAFLAFGAIAAVSSIFSFYPFLSLAKGIAFLLACGVAIIASSAFRPGEVLKYLYYVFTAILLIELVVKIAGGFPLLDVDDYTGRAKLSLFGLHPTLLGELSSITLLSGLLLPKRPPIYCQGFLLILAVVSGTRTGSTMLLVVLVATWLVSLRLSPRLVSLYCGLACVSVIVLVASQLNDQANANIAAITRPVYGDMLSRDASTLDGRTDVWNAAAPALSRSVFLGYGLGGARDALVNNTSKFWVAGDAHNAFVELALGGGFIALLIYLFGWGAAARRAWQSQGSIRIGALALYFYIFVFGIVAPDLTNLQALGTFLIITVDAMVCEELVISRAKRQLVSFVLANAEPVENPACT